MNTKYWIENDINPCISFGNSGEIKYLNKAAEVLFAYTNKKDIFDLAVTYAPQSYGYKTIFTQIKFQKLHFCAIGVGYDSDDEITIRLYYNFIEQKSILNSNKNIQKTNIYQLIEAITNSVLIENSIKFKFIFDTSLPFIFINQNSFAVMFRDIFCQNILPKIITIFLKIKIGEFIKIDNTRYQVIELNMDIPNIKKSSTIEKMAKDNNIIIHYNRDNIIIDIALIKSI